MKNKVIKISIISIIVIIVILGSMYFSFVKFAVINPLSTCIGLGKILLTDTEYTVVQNKPFKVIFSKDENAQELLDKYMNERGFYIEDRMGGLLIYTDGKDEESINFSVNGYYSIWEWV